MSVTRANRPRPFAALAGLLLAAVCGILAPALAADLTIFGSSTPANTATSDPSAVELGVKFRSDVSGSITGVRFYKSSSNTGTHTGSLWTSTGSRLGTGTFTNETASGWQQLTFATPVQIAANTTYVASYHTNVGNYSYNSAAFASAGVDAPPLHALKDGQDGPNGLYLYGAGAFPTQSYNATNYWVDVSFASPPDTTPPTVSAVTPAGGATGVPPTAPVTATFSEPVDPATINTTTVVLKDAAANVVPATVSYNAATSTATLTPSTALSSTASYSATIRGGGTDPRVKDVAGNALAANFTWSFSTGSSTSYLTIWPNTSTPANASINDPSAIELGVKFRSDVDGYVAGIRFYKGASNTGTHTGSLWSLGGARLGTATFTGESASGWQQVTFTSPVLISANTTYVASYHTNAGNYAANGAYFASSGFDNAPLHALQNGADGSNGLYLYGGGGFPTQSYNSTNYWVDVLFAPNPSSDTTPPTVASVSPASGSAGVALNTAVLATFSEAMDPASISASSFELRGPSNSLVTATVAYDSSSKTASLRPAAALAAGTAYTATVKGGATDPRTKDLAGNALAANFSWSFTTVTADTTPPTVTAVSPAVGATGVSAGVTVTATFSEAIDPATIGTTTFELRDAANALVPASVAYDAASRTATLSPSGSLATNTSYTAAVRGGASDPRVKDLAGNPLAASYSWSFTTGAFVSLWGKSGAPAVASANDPSAIELGVKFRSDVDGYVAGIRFYKGAGNTGTHIGTLWSRTGAKLANAAFTGETSTGWQEVWFSTPVKISANTTYVASYHTDAGNYSYTGGYFASAGFDNPPLHALKDGADGGNGVYTYGAINFPNQTYNATNYWVDVLFTTTPPPPSPDEGPGGPILVIAGSSNPFGRYYGEILRAEGLNEFTVTDISLVTASRLTSYSTVILGELPLTGAQVTMLTNWVNAGGNLVAMRPDKQLASLLGLTDASSTLSNAYLLVNTVAGPGVGIVNQSMQFHGTADLYTLSGATSVADLYLDAGTTASRPAVTLRSVGANGGHAAAFTYDLARSVVYTRQGNPAWSGLERDGQPPVRSDDLYYGAAAGNVQPDWVDFTKIQIPQADEQQRLLANLLLSMAPSKPLPRFWYFPKGKKAVVIMTGDDHSNGGTVGRFDHYLSLDAPGASVVDWETVRSTSYIYTDTPISDAQAAAYAAKGFEIALHVNTGVQDWTSTFQLDNWFSSQLATFSAKYVSLPTPNTNRTHAIVWSDWASQPLVELSHGIRLDTTYYYWPNTWIQNRPGVFTGSGIPMRFANLDGSLIDVYQAPSQMTDESGQIFPFTCDTLLDNALGAQGFYGAFTANMHTDLAASTGSDAIVSSALSRGVPVVSARQMLTWLDGRTGSTFSGLAWTGSTMSFTISVGTGARNLQAMVPTSSASGTLTSILFNGTSIPYTTQVIKGISYAFFSASPGAYQATYH